MESGLYISVLSSWEVIAACLFVLFMLPLIFFVASTKSRRRIPVRVRGLRAPAKKRAQSQAPRPAEDQVGDEGDERPSARRGERPGESEEDT